MRSILASDLHPGSRAGTASAFGFYFASELAQLASGFTLLEGFKFAWVGFAQIFFRRLRKARRALLSGFVT
jgi:hypothetical protein